MNRWWAWSSDIVLRARMRRLDTQQRGGGMFMQVFLIDDEHAVFAPLVMLCLYRVLSNKSRDVITLNPATPETLYWRVSSVLRAESLSSSWFQDGALRTLANESFLLMRLSRALTALEKVCLLLDLQICEAEEIMLFIGKPRGRSIMISNVRGRFHLSL